MTESERRAYVKEHYGLELEDFDERVRRGMVEYRRPNIQQMPREPKTVVLCYRPRKWRDA